MSSLNLKRPGSLDEALSMKGAEPALQPIAGGTDLMVQGLAPSVLDLSRVDALRGVEIGDSDELFIGALTTFSEVATSPLVEAWAPVVQEMARSIGAHTIQNRATVGGNIGNASPVGDSLPLWMALDARLRVASAARGVREIPFEFLFKGYRTLATQPDELILGVVLPEVRRTDFTHYRKVAARAAQAISKVLFAGRLRIEDGVVAEARIAFGAVAEVPLRLQAVEQALVGHPVDPQVARLVADEVRPIDDIRSTAEYRRRVSVNVVRAWLEHLAGRA